MSYENAPATELLASRCCACGRELVDAPSVESGIGPVCAEKYGFPRDGEGPERTEANAIVYRVAANQGMTDQERDKLLTLGFPLLAARLAERLQGMPRVRIWEENGYYVVKHPYNEDTLPDWRALRSNYRGKWDRERKVNMIPVHSETRRHIWALLQANFPGAILESPKGISVIPEP